MPPPDRGLDLFLRGFLLGAFACACFLGPDWLAVQLKNSGIDTRAEAPANGEPAWRHLGDLIGLVRLVRFFAQALLSPLRQWFALGWLALRMVLMLGVVSLTRSPLGHLLRAILPSSWALRGGNRGLARTAWLGLAISGAILLGALLMLAPVLKDQTWAREGTPRSDAECRIWRPPWGCRIGDRRACQQSTSGEEKQADALISAPIVFAGLPLADAFATGWHRLRTGSPVLDNPGGDPLARLGIQVALGLALVPALLLGDALYRCGLFLLSLKGQARLRRLINLQPAITGVLAALPTWRLMSTMWAIRFQHASVVADEMRNAQTLAAVELDALADLLFWRCIVVQTALVLRAFCLRPDLFNQGLRLLCDDMHAGLHSSTSSLPLRLRQAGFERLLQLIRTLCLEPLAVQTAAVARALATAPPTYLFWHATALAVAASSTDRWLMVLLMAVAIGVRLLADGVGVIIPLRSVHRRRWLNVLQLSIELLLINVCLYPTFLMALSPVLVAAGFRGTGSLHLHTTLSLPTIPPRSAVVCLLPSLLAAAARSAELWCPGATQARRLVPSAAIVSGTSERESDVSEVSGNDFEGTTVAVEEEAGERWGDAVESANWWLLGLLHLMRDRDEDSSDWSVASPNTARREREREQGRTLRRSARFTLEEWMRRNLLMRSLPAELREPIATLVSSLAAPLVSGHEAAAVRDATLSVLSELLSTALSFKLLTRTGRHQLRRGLEELVQQQQASAAAPPKALCINTTAVNALCSWLRDPAIGVGGVLRPPPDEYPPESIRPPPDSEHDVDYSRDTIGILTGGPATREARLSLFLDLAGGTFFHIAGLQLRVAIDEREAKVGTGLHLRVRWQPPTGTQRRKGRLGALRLDVELEQPQRVTLDLGGLSIFNATLGTMPLKGPVRIAGKGGRLRAAVTLVVEGGATLASCSKDELPEHVREHGGGIFFSLEKLRLEDSGFELDEASQRIWDDLLEGSSNLLRALRFLRWNMPLVAAFYPRAKAAWGAVSSTFSAVTGLWEPPAEVPTSPKASTSGSLPFSPSWDSFDAVAGRVRHKSLAGGGNHSARLVDDILRLIGDAACANSQNQPIFTWGVLQNEAPEVAAFLRSAAQRQESRDNAEPMPIARAQSFASVPLAGEASSSWTPPGDSMSTSNAPTIARGESLGSPPAPHSHIAGTGGKLVKRSGGGHAIRASASMHASMNPSSSRT